MTEEEFVARAMAETQGWSWDGMPASDGEPMAGKDDWLDCARAAIKAVDEYRAVPIVGEVE